MKRLLASALIVGVSSIGLVGCEEKTEKKETTTVTTPKGSDTVTTTTTEKKTGNEKTDSGTR